LYFSGCNIFDNIKLFFLTVEPTREQSANCFYCGFFNSSNMNEIDLENIDLENFKRENIYYYHLGRRNYANIFNDCDTGVVTDWQIREWKAVLFVKYNNEDFLYYLTTFNELGYLFERVLEVLLGDYTKQWDYRNQNTFDDNYSWESRYYEIRKKWLEHTIFICKNEYNKTKNEIYNEVAKWCEDYEEEFLPLDKPQNYDYETLNSLKKMYEDDNKAFPEKLEEKLKILTPLETNTKTNNLAFILTNNKNLKQLSDLHKELKKQNFIDSASNDFIKVFDGKKGKINWIGNAPISEIVYFYYLLLDKKIITGYNKHSIAKACFTLNNKILDSPSLSSFYNGYSNNNKALPKRSKEIDEIIKNVFSL